jgi:hypothetical protein
VLFLYKFLIFISCIVFFIFGLFWVSAFERTYVRSTAFCAAFDLALVSSTAAQHTPMRAAFGLTVVSSTTARPAQHTLRHACGRTYPVSSNANTVAPFAPGTSAVGHTYVRSNVLELGRF